MKKRLVKLVFLILGIFLFLYFGLNLLTASLDISSITSTVNTLNFSTTGAIYGSSLVSSGFVYFGSADNKFYQLNASDLSSVANFTASNMFASTPAIFNNFVYVRGVDGNYFYQLNASNVSQQIATYPLVSIGTSPSTPAIFNNSVYITNNNFLLQLNASNVSQQIANFTDNVLDFSSPKINGTYIYVTDTFGILYQLNVSNVSQQITNFTPAIIPSPAISDGFVYTGNNGAFYQLNASNVSQQIASYPIIGALSFNTYASTPTVANGSVYIATGSSCSFGCNNSVLYQLNASNVSQQIANYTTNYQGINVWGPPTVSGNYVYIGNKYHIFYQLDASNVSQQIANYTTLGVISSAPSFGNGFVYIGDQAGIFYQLNISNIANNPCETSYTCDNFGSCIEGIQTRSCHKLCNGSVQYTDETKTCFIDLGGHVAQSSGGGGGGGNSFVSPAVNVTPDKPVEITINNSNMDLNSLILNVKKEAANSSVNITRLSANNSILLTGLPIGRLYQAFIIEPGINNSDIINATINFRINKTWLAENNITFHYNKEKFWLLEDNIVGNIILYRNPDGANAWFPLTTNYSYQDNESYHFYAYSTGFSTFAIFLNKYDCLPNSARCDNSEVQVCLGNSTWLVTEHCTYGCQGRVCSTGFFQSDQFKFLSEVITIAVIIIGLILIFYKKIKRKNKVKLSRKERKEIRKQKKKMKKEKYKK